MFQGGASPNYWNKCEDFRWTQEGPNYMRLSNCCMYVCPCESAGDWGSGLLELYVYYWVDMKRSLYYKIKRGFALADKSNDIVDICDLTGINGACAWRFGECMGLLCYGK